MRGGISVFPTKSDEILASLAYHTVATAAIATLLALL